AWLCAEGSLAGATLYYIINTARSGSSFMKIARLAFAAVSTLAIAAPVPALAQEAQEAAPDRNEAARPAPVPDDDFHGQAIYVTAPGLQRLALLAGTSVLTGTDLQRNLDGQVGEVLARLPGVSATSFAPGVSRP